MGSAHLLLLSPSTLFFLGLNPTKPSISPKFSAQFRCSFSSRPRWDPYPDSSRGDRFDFDEGFRFGGRVREKRRNWWSDDEDDDDDDDEDDEFGFWDEPSATDWVCKILRAFAWMIPAVAISAVLGTGPNSLIMALVLPLGQTALSLAMDKLWAGPSSSPDPRPRSRPRGQPKHRPERDPFASFAGGPRKTRRGAGRPSTGTRTMNGSYQSSGAANNSSSAKKSGKSGSKFGGWDELDELSNTVPKEGQNQKAEGQNQKAEGLETEHTTTVKLSTTRKGERPFFLRLLIAVFPFLGSWTRFLF